MGAVRDSVQIDISQMKQYLRVDHDYDDPIIETMIDSAVQWYDDYLNLEEEDDVPSSVSMAIYRTVASWYEGRTDSIDSARVGDAWQEFGEPPWSAAMLVQNVRRNPGL